MYIERERERSRYYCIYVLYLPVENRRAGPLPASRRLSCAWTRRNVCLHTYVSVCVYIYIYTHLSHSLSLSICIYIYICVCSTSR